MIHNRDVRITRMIPGAKNANTALSSITYGSAAGAIRGTADMAGCDLALILVTHNVGNATKNIWRFYEASAATTKTGSATIITGFTASNTVSTAIYGYYYNPNAHKRFLSCKLSAVTSSTWGEVLCIHGRNEQFPPATTGITTVTEVT